MQARAPLPKGFQAFGGRLAAFSGANRSGRKASTSPSHTLGSRWSIGSRIRTVSAVVSGYLPASTVSLCGLTEKAAAVGQTRRLSIRICSM